MELQSLFRAFLKLHKHDFAFLSSIWRKDMYFPYSQGNVHSQVMKITELKVEGKIVIRQEFRRQ